MIHAEISCLMTSLLCSLQPFQHPSRASKPPIMRPPSTCHQTHHTCTLRPGAGGKEGRVVAEDSVEREEDGRVSGEKCASHWEIGKGEVADTYDRVREE